jgi:hypothetical protein
MVGGCSLSTAKETQDLVCRGDAKALERVEGDDFPVLALAARMTAFGVNNKCLILSSYSVLMDNMLA